MKDLLQSVTVIQFQIHLVCSSLWQSHTDEAESAVLNLLFHLLFFCLL